MARRPLIPTAAISEFGDLTDQSFFKDPVSMDNDITYVPGSSELRRQNALKFAEYAKGECARTDIPDLPVKLVWVRNQDKSGKPDNSRVFQFEQDGYRMVNATEDAGQSWLTKAPPSANKQADGSIRCGDSVLMVCTAESARREEAYLRAETERRLTGATNTFEAALRQAHQAENVPIPAGLSPTVEKMEQGEALFERGVSPQLSASLKNKK